MSSSPSSFHQAQRIRVRLACDTDLDRIRADLQQTSLRRQLRHRTLLLACRGEQVCAAMGLELDTAEVCPWPGPDGNIQPQLFGRLLRAVEQRAVWFGLLEVRIQAGSQRQLLHETGYRPAARNGWLKRSLKRRQTRYARQIAALSARLGIPPDYGRVHRMPLQAEPGSLSSIGPDVFGREQRLRPPAAAAWQRLVAAAQREQGIILQAVSAYRPVAYQQGIVERKLAQGQSMTQILRVSAAPGYSEHHTGNAVDITMDGYRPLEEEFEHSPAFAWLTRRAGKFGFVLSYPPDNHHRLAYEPWHWCFRRPARPRRPAADPA